MVGAMYSAMSAAALAGAATYLSRFFVANPILFLKELDLLAAKGVTPTVYVDPTSAR